MKVLLFLLLLPFPFLAFAQDNPQQSQDNNHGFTLENDSYIWRGNFDAGGLESGEIAELLMQKLYSNPYLKHIYQGKNGVISGAIEGLLEPIPTTGMLTSSFGFSIYVGAHGYEVRTSDWSLTSTNSAMYGSVLSLEKAVDSPLVGKKRTVAMLEGFKNQQVKIFLIE